jgi:hypothetical protein
METSPFQRFRAAMKAAQRRFSASAIFRRLAALMWRFGSGLSDERKRVAVRRNRQSLGWSPASPGFVKRNSAIQPIALEDEK